MSKLIAFVARAATLLVVVAAPVLHAQQPTAQQVQTALATQPGLVALLRSKIATSGMTADQIRARLRSAGYPDSLLNAYLPGTTDTTVTTTNDALNAVRYLGLVDQAQQDSLSKLLALRDTTHLTTTLTTTPAAPPPSPIFGLDVFRRATSQFEPDLAGPVDASYRLGPHDVLAVMLTGGIETSYTLEVTREGFVVIPQVGQIYVANLSLEQATDVLLRRLRAVYSHVGTDPRASTRLFVTVARLRVNQVFVIGDVLSPGSYQVSGAGTMITALYAASGPSDNGGLRDIQLRRGGKVVGHFDLYRYLISGDASSDQRLETGDVVFVPVHGARVQIQGEVVRPDIYEMAPGESFDDLIHLAGGFTASANRRRIVLQRIVPSDERTSAGSDRTVVMISANGHDGDGGGAMPLADGDSIQVLRVADKVRNMVSVAGAVWNPGAVGYSAGLMLSDALRLAGGVRPDVKSVQINRLQSDQSRRELRAEFRDTLGSLMHDLPLQEDDSITVFAATDFRPDRYVAISGAVRVAGKYPYREGMTLRDLLNYAGGLNDGAYLDHAEVARLPDAKTGNRLSVTLEARMDSSYLLERNLDGSYHGPPGLTAAGSGAPEVTLQPYDNVLILRQPDWSLDRTVVLKGEFRFPGEYTLQSKNEKLADLVVRAGGLTSVSYPRGAVLVRVQGNIGRVAVDFARALHDTTYRDNIVMQNGDTLYVPPYRSVVDVRGAVNSPIAVAYNPGADIFYYISSAGGLTYNGDRNRAYVQQPNGIVQPFKEHFLRPDSRPRPEPGAVVVVPNVDPNSKKDWTAIAGTVAQILATTTTLIVVLTRVK
jgi:polysaccharide export outer membrane protein